MSTAHAGHPNNTLSAIGILHSAEPGTQTMVPDPSLNQAGPLKFLRVNFQNRYFWPVNCKAYLQE